MSKKKKTFEKIKLNKLDVALRQLREAIHLFFEERDCVSVHTLAMASYQILYDIAKKEDIKDVMYDSLVIKDEYRGLAKSYLNKSKNFFKHANKDPDGEVEFSPDYNSFVLFSCVDLMEKMQIRKRIEHFVLSWWFMCSHRTLVKEEFLSTPEMFLFMYNVHVQEKIFWLSILKRFTTHEEFLEWLKSLSTKSGFQKRQEMYDIFLKPHD